jgi:hypothetical protein
MRRALYLTLLALPLWFAPSVGHGAAISDTLVLTVTGGGLTIHSRFFQLLQDAGETVDNTFLFPGLTIDFLQAADSTQISDRFHVDPW